MNIVTIVNFIRSQDSRTTRTALKEAVVRQVALAEQYKMPITFLFQHDAFIDSEMRSLVPMRDYIEIGLWLEVNRILVEKAGVQWKGGDNCIWSPLANVDLTAGYLPQERIQIADTVMAEFRECFGCYPATVGSWMIDAVTLEHLDRVYGVQASLNCKDQWGTDGYSLWGGYYNQAFYPCKNNAFCPAQSRQAQIDIPVFRMLGSDPIAQYACESDDNGQNVVSLEPVYPESGGSRQWVTWFFEQMINNEPLSFGYAQAGQENSFGWDLMGNGYQMQMELLHTLHQQGKINVMKVCDAGAYFKKTYAVTPASVVQAANAGGEQVLWYSSRYYRIGIYAGKQEIYIRDLMLFDEAYRERYLQTPCTSPQMYYDNLPVVDSYRCSTETETAGVFFEKDGKRIRGDAQMQAEKVDDVTMRVYIETAAERICLTLYEDRVVLKGGYAMAFQLGAPCMDVLLKSAQIALTYNRFSYTVPITGMIDSNKILPDHGTVALTLAKRAERVKR